VVARQLAMDLSARFPDWIHKNFSKMRWVSLLLCLLPLAGRCSESDFEAILPVVLSFSLDGEAIANTKFSVANSGLDRAAKRLGWPPEKTRYYESYSTDDFGNALIYLWSGGSQSANESPLQAVVGEVSITVNQHPVKVNLAEASARNPIALDDAKLLRISIDLSNIGKTAPSKSTESTDK